MASRPAEEVENENDIQDFLVTSFLFCTFELFLKPLLISVQPVLCMQVSGSGVFLGSRSSNISLYPKQKSMEKVLFKKNRNMTGNQQEIKIAKISY